MNRKTKVLPLLAAGAVLFSMASAMPAGAAKITLIRGATSEVVDSNAGGRGPVVLREREVTTAAPVSRGAPIVVVLPARALAGDTLWLRTKRGLKACTLGGSGIAGVDRIYCTRY